MAINFEKLYTSTDAIVGILQERGLNVDNQEQAADILKNVGYYRGLIVGDEFLSLCARSVTIYFPQTAVYLPKNHYLYPASQCEDRLRLGKIQLTQE